MMAVKTTMHSTAAHKQMNPRNEVWTKRKNEDQHKKEWKSQQYRWKMTEGNKEVWRQNKERKKEINKDKREGKKAKRMRELGKESEKKGRQKLKRETEERKGNETKDETEKTQSNMIWIHSHSCLRHFVFSQLSHTQQSFTGHEPCTVMQFGILHNEDVLDIQVTSYCSNSKTQEDIMVLTCSLHEATWNAQFGGENISLQMVSLKQRWDVDGTASWSFTIAGTGI